jgi:hypothetical protein
MKYFIKYEVIGRFKTVRLLTSPMDKSENTLITKQIGTEQTAEQVRSLAQRMAL